MRVLARAWEAVQQAYAEIEQQRSETVRAIRGFMTAESKTGEQLFAHIDGTSAAAASVVRNTATRLLEKCRGRQRALYREKGPCTDKGPYTGKKTSLKGPYTGKKDPYI